MGERDESEDVRPKTYIFLKSTCGLNFENFTDNITGCLIVQTPLNTTKRIAYIVSYREKVTVSHIVIHINIEIILILSYCFI